MNLRNKKILLTGATGGIGTALVEQLTKEGATILAHGRNAAKLDSLTAAYKNVVPLVGDLSSQEDLDMLLNAIETHDRDLDILILNAGIQQHIELASDLHGMEKTKHEMTVNALIPMQLSSALLPLLLERDEAAVVGVTSLLAYAPKQSAPVYSASKAALKSFLQALGYQLEGTSVQVIEWIPPLVDTPMTEGRGTRKMTPEDCAARFTKSLLHSRRVCSPGVGRFIPALLRLAPGFIQKKIREPDSPTTI
ncbi:MAG: hypothetical protein CL946_06390 [Ectothiorhodospiraceae bacterium]|nr:hypothetical protein [Ectothiorhodospiraceae bacterium]